MKKIHTLLLLFVVSALFAQEKKHLTVSDAVLGYYKGLYPQRKSLQWVEGSNQIAVQNKNSLFATDAMHPEFEKKTAFLSLADLQKTYPELKRFPYRFDKITAEEVVFSNANMVYTYNYIQSKAVSAVKTPENAANSEYNAEANAVAYTIDNNLYVATTTDAKLVVTAIENKNIVSGQAIARSEMGITKGTFWSPKGNFLAFYQKDESKVATYPLVDITTTPASLMSIKYPMNGMDSEIAKAGIFDLKTQKTIYLNIDTSDEHYLTNLSWSPDEKYILLAEVNRDQNHMWYNIYNAKTGVLVKTLFEEQNPKWVEPEHIAVFVPNSNTEFLWLSERDGFMNIYKYDINKGYIKQLTKFNWVIKEIIGFDKSKKCVIVSGTGADARENKAYKIMLKNGKSKALTNEAGTHNVQLSPNGAFIIDTYSSLDTPRVVKVKTTEKNKERTLFEAPNPLKDYQMGETTFVTLKAKDGSDLYGRIIKPYNFDPTKKYPVMVYLYGGPHAQLVTNSWLGGSRLWMQWMAAENDYIMFTIDNHGSASRGFAFESVIHRQMGEVEMEDQLIGVDYLKSLPYVDSNRLAVHGWSFGGFMTNSLMLRHPGVFTTAVAGGPVTDWKYYEIMYGERYMDRWQDNEAGFKKSRVHNYVKNLDGKLLEIIGSVDPVVVPQHTMTLLQEFVKQGVQVDYFTYPMHEHNVRGRDRVHLMEKILNYIIENNK
jgi:dipeptidyl-peptidase-4